MNFIFKYFCYGVKPYLINCIECYMYIFQLVLRRKGCVDICCLKSHAHLRVSSNALPLYPERTILQNNASTKSPSTGR